ncbi:hypothetical protein [Oceanimonas smirnovii]|uniref:hypothetical protein n=1 Tax=Oceanimonas smirnovii TaxID=264574 RepID=UPI003FD47297
MSKEKRKELCSNLEQVSNTVSISINLWNTLIAPVVIAVLLNEVFDAAKKNESISYSVIVMAIITFIVHIACGYIAHKINKNHSMLIEYQEQEEQLQVTTLQFNNLRGEYIQHVGCYAAQVAALRHATEALDEAIGNMVLAGLHDVPRITTDQLHDAMRSFIWPLTVYRDKLFGERSGERWNYSIYLYNHDDEVLRPVARLMDIRIEARNREWKPGFGTVGLSFLHNEIKLIPDLEKYNPSSQSTPEEIEKYRCIIALPILACEDTGDNGEDPRGVLVLTSNRPNCYNLDRDASFLLALTKIISIYLEKLISTAPDIVTPTNNKDDQHEQTT